MKPLSEVQKFELPIYFIVLALYLWKWLQSYYSIYLQRNMIYYFLTRKTRYIIAHSCEISR